MAAVVYTELRKYVPLLASGKVRELYDLGASELLFVTTDRISAFDVVMNNAVDEKGSILTQLSKFWFELLQQKLPDLKHHLVSLGLPQYLKDKLEPSLVDQLNSRSMVVKKVKVLPLESIVRGYITGSAWSSYQKEGSVCGIALPSGLKESQKLDYPLWTPSTKAELGGHDENISPEEAAKIVGPEWAGQIEKLSLAIYTTASAFAAERGIIIADTKFEFGIDESSTPPSLILIDEVLTPDSSRFWNGKTYEPGRGQESFDKQYLRDWLKASAQRSKADVIMPEDIVTNTAVRYKEAFHILVGTPWESK